MDVLIIEATDTTPKVHLDADNEIFKFEGRCYPANPDEFFEPVVEWLIQYCEAPNKETELNFNLSFFNTSTAMILARLLFILADVPIDTSYVHVKWYYFRTDYDLKRLGEDMGMVTHIPVKLLAFE